MGEFRIETDRLILREWCDDDAAAMHAIGQDDRVMQSMGPLLTRDDAEKLVAGQIVNQRIFGHCFWPIERRSDARLLGYCGVQLGPSQTPLEGRTEIGWLLAYDAWGQGYAREAAAAAIAWFWENLSDEALWAITTPANLRSQGLMRRLGMKRIEELDFDHPGVPTAAPLRRTSPTGCFAVNHKTRLHTLGRRRRRRGTGTGAWTRAM